ncbi:hypothetical protein H0H87_011126, partial [Tephrocybe sp. NHM501043]
VISEVEPEHDNEWAADKIISHSSSASNSIFEVLWRAGDRTWMPYDQVKELDLLQPYLEVQGVETIANLPVGKGTPPIDDPQTFLMLISLTPTYSSVNYASYSPDHTFHSTPIYTNYNMSTNQVFRPKSHYKLSPYLTQCNDSMLILKTDDITYTIHPYQLSLYVAFDKDVRRLDVTIMEDIPFGYAEFALVYNKHKGDNPCAFCVWDDNSSSFTRDTIPFPSSIF